MELERNGIGSCCYYVATQNNFSINICLYAPPPLLITVLSHQQCTNKLTPPLPLSSLIVPVYLFIYLFIYGRGTCLLVPMYSVLLI
jgi:hypothetical protein